MIETPSVGATGEGRDGRSRIRLALDYIKARRNPAAIAMITAAILGTAVALLLPSKYTARERSRL